MGILLEEVCCVDSSNLMESEKYQSSYYREGVGRKPIEVIYLIMKNFMTPL